MDKAKIIITSVGSLVGQNILDVLEYEKLYRRDLFEVIGTNSIAGSPNNFRCDRCYLVPNTNTQEFKIRITEIISDEKPDIIFSGRDEDTLTLAGILKSNPDLKGKLPYGAIRSLENALDKVKTWKFSQKYDLPFAATFELNEKIDESVLCSFIDTYGYPLIAKPIQGYASKGVFLINTFEEALEIMKWKDYMLQEYLGRGEDLEDYIKSIKKMVPLFAHAPSIFHHSCHTVIQPDGSYDPIFVSRNVHDSGVTIGFRKVYNEELNNLTEKFVNAIYAEGGYGPVTVQFRKNRNGEYKAQEMNMRTNGNTFPRFIMGQDDIGLICKYLVPDSDIPINKPKNDSEKWIIGKKLTSYRMDPSDLQKLGQQKYWKK